MQMNCVGSHATTVDPNSVVLTVSDPSGEIGKYPIRNIKIKKISNSYRNTHKNTYSGMWVLQKDQAKKWLYSLTMDSISTWVEFITLFLKKFFPTYKTAKLRNEINQFRQAQKSHSGNI